MPKPIVIFDFDGTLIDSRADLTTAVNLTRADFGLPPLPLDTVTRYVGDGVRKLMERAFTGTPVNVDAAVPKMKAHYLDHMLDATTLYPGATAALAALQAQGYNLAIVTNKPTQPAHGICRHLGIAPYFGAILGGDSCPKLKPDPEPLYQAMRLTGSGATGSWVVGDNYTDMAAGARAGLQRCFCAFGFGDLQGEAYDLKVDSLTEFAAHLAGRP